MEIVLWRPCDGGEVFSRCAHDDEDPIWHKNDRTKERATERFLQWLAVNVDRINFKQNWGNNGDRYDEHRRFNRLANYSWRNHTIEIKDDYIVVKAERVERALERVARRQIVGPDGLTYTREEMVRPEPVNTGIIDEANFGIYRTTIEVWEEQ